MHNYNIITIKTIPKTAISQGFIALKTKFNEKDIENHV